MKPYYSEKQEIGEIQDEIDPTKWKTARLVVVAVVQVCPRTAAARLSCEIRNQGPWAKQPAVLFFWGGA